MIKRIVALVFCVCAFRQNSHNMYSYVSVSHEEHSAKPFERARSNNFKKEKEIDSQPIRQWGCEGRNETPLIFVHVGKTSGGTVRARLEASSLNYSRRHWNEAYFPVRDGYNGTMNRGTFCSSTYYGHSPHNATGGRAHFPRLPCNASTPLGHAIACPMPTQKLGRKRNIMCYTKPESTASRVVFVGHNSLGSEMQWLPAGYLSRWWSDNWASRGDDGRLDNNDKIAPFWKTLFHGGKWCPERNKGRPFSERDYHGEYDACSRPLQEHVDMLATETLLQKLGKDNNTTTISSWTPIYASLPLLRVTLVREPFSWLLSKFFWHRQSNTLNLTCDDVENAVLGGSDNRDIGQYPIYRSMGSVDKGWVTQMALGHILKLCGEDCEVRNVMGTSSLAQVEEQAKDNLRQSFAVVGLMNERDTFFEMLTARVDYLDTSLNPDVVGEIHATHPLDHELHCKALFANPAFQQRLISRSPAIAALVRLYNVAVEVNQFQLNEMKQCGISIG